MAHDWLSDPLLYQLAAPVIQVAYGIAGNAADRLVCSGIGRIRNAIRNGAITSESNHDLQRAARRAYLNATLIMATHAGDDAAPRAIREELRGLDRSVPAATTDQFEEFLNPGEVFRARLMEILESDLIAWGATRRPSIERMARDGWHHNGAACHWVSLVSVHFMEEIKSNQRVSNIFTAHMLAGMNLEEFTRHFETIHGKLDRMEGKIDQILDIVKPPDTGPVIRLDAPPVNFVPRLEELDWLHQQLAQPGASLLHGEPGSGKSTLALHFAHNTAASGLRSVIWIFCGPHRGAEPVGVELASRLPNFNKEAPPEDQIEQARNWLRHAGALLVLDDAWEESLSSLNPGPPANVLYTSRNRYFAGLPWDRALHIEGFKPPETEQLIERRLPGWLAGHREPWLAFAAQVEHLPIALDVAADLLARSPLPVLEAIAQLSEMVLASGRLALFQEAAGMHPEPARRLLAAISVCSPAGAWLPLAAEVAGLELQEAWPVIESLARTALVRTIDRDQSLFGIHAVLRDWLHKDLASGLHQAHTGALIRRFSQWEEDWQDCTRLLGEVEPALRWLAVHNPDRHGSLAFNVLSHGLRTGHLLAAYNAMESARQLAEQLGDRAGLQASYGNQALILKAWGRLEEAMALLKQQEAICTELGDRAGLQRSYGNQALILQDWGRLEEAMALLKKQEAICTELGDRAGLARCYGNQGLLFRELNDLAQAREKLTAALDLFTQLGMPREIEQTGQNLDNLDGPDSAADQAASGQS